MGTDQPGDAALRALDDHMRAEEPEEYGFAEYWRDRRAAEELLDTAGRFLESQSTHEYPETLYDPNDLLLPPEGQAALTEDLRNAKVERSTAMKFDTTKVRYDLLPPEAMQQWALAMTYGVFKYEAWNWANGIAASKYYGSLQRHLMAWWTGESYDPETADTCHHLGQVMFAAACLLTLELRGALIDDRHPPVAPIDGNIPAKLVEAGIQAKAKALGVSAQELAAEAGVVLSDQH